jgi:hypothetical protein
MNGGEGFDPTPPEMRFAAGETRACFLSKNSSNTAKHCGFTEAELLGKRISAFAGFDFPVAGFCLGHNTCWT